MKKKMISIGTACLLILAAVLALPGGEATALQQEEIQFYAENFESGLPSDWDFENGWQIEQDESGQFFAAQGHIWATPQAGPWENYRIHLRLQLTGNHSAIHVNVRRAGVMRYFIGLNTGGVYLSKQTSSTQFYDGLAQSGGLSIGWHDIEVSAYGDTISLNVDGVQRFTYTDPSPLLSGSIAFESLTDAQVGIDDIEVWGPAPDPTPTPQPGESWVRTGGPLGGLGYDVRMLPSNPDVMFVTDSYAGVFISQDGGENWGQSNEGISTRTGSTADAIPIFSLTIDPNNESILWAGTQNQRGVFKSTDGGLTWTQKVNGILEQGLSIRGITINPGNSDVVYIAGELSSSEWNHGVYRMGREFEMVGGVVYKSIDGGESWQAVWRGDNLARYIWIDPGNTDIVYISTGIFDREAANSDPQSGTPGGEGVLKSMDGGLTWNSANQGLGNLYVGTLFMNPDDSKILLAGTGNNQYYSGNGVYVTVDGAQSWQHTLSGQNIEAVEFSSANSLIAYAASSDAVFRSQDGGMTWEEKISSANELGWGPPGVRAGFPIDLQVDPRNSDRVFANAYGGGNFLSEDGGDTWSVASQGYTGAQVRDIAVDPQSSGRVLAAARSGLFVSYAGGSRWEGLSFQPISVMEFTAIAIDPSNPLHLLTATSWGNQLAQSMDGGYSWSVTLAKDNERIGWGAIAFAPSNTEIVYAGSAGYYSAGTFSPEMSADGLFRSMDGGTSWQECNDNNSENAAIYDLAVHSSDPDMVYAASSTNGILKTTDGGDHWILQNSGLPGTPAMMTVEINPQDTQSIFAGHQRASIFHSVDGGNTWQSAGIGLNPEASISDIVIDSSNPQTMYAADVFSGVYISEDGGEIWRAINTGLSMRAVNALALSQDGQYLYAATEGGGVYRLDRSGEPPAEYAGDIGSSTEIPPAPSPTTARTATNAIPDLLPTPTTGPAAEGFTMPAICGGAAPLGMVAVFLTFKRQRNKKARFSGNCCGG